MLLIMACILGIYGLIVVVILNKRINDNYGVNRLMHILLQVFAVDYLFLAWNFYGISGDAGVRALGQIDKIFVDMIFILIFAEVLDVYGLILSFIVSC